MVFIIGITGGTASGKSTFAKNLQKMYVNKGLQSTLIHMDDFYKGISKFSESELVKLRNNNLNLDDPSMVDLKLMTDIISNPTKTYRMPVYHRESYDTSHYKDITLINTDVVIVEGIFIFNDANFEEFDMTIYVDTPMPIRLMRRLMRYPKDKQEKQLEYYNKFVVMSYMKYIKPYRYRCQYVVDGEKSFEENIKILSDSI